MKIWLLIVTTLIGTSSAHAQAPSTEEQQYLISIVPLIQSGALGEAEIRLNEGLRLYPHSAVLSNAIGVVYEKEGKVTAAVAAFEEALRSLPSFTAAQIQLASLYARQGECAKATPLFNHASGVTDSGALSTIGVGLAQCQDFPNAVRVLERVHRQIPSSVSVAYNLALAYFKQQQFRSALDTLQSLPAGPESDKPDVFYLRAKAMQALALPGSGDVLSRACEAQPSEDYCSVAAVQLMREERLLEALKILEITRNRIAPSSSLLSTLGMVEFRLGRYTDSAKTYAQAIEIDPNSDAPREGLVFLYYMTGDLDRARAAADEGLRRRGADFYLDYLRALVLNRLSRDAVPDALASVDKAIAKNPSFAPSYYLRGKIKMTGGDLRGALTDFEKASSLDANYALPHYKMAQIYLRQGKEAEAERAEKRFTALGSRREEEVLARQTQDLLAPAAN